MEVQEWDDWNSIPSQSVNSEIGIPGNNGMGSGFRDNKIWNLKSEFGKCYIIIVVLF